jgi:hypothetical protein
MIIMSYDSHVYMSRAKVSERRKIKLPLSRVPSMMMSMMGKIIIKREKIFSKASPVLFHAIEKYFYIQ